MDEYFNVRTEFIDFTAILLVFELLINKTVAIYSIGSVVRNKQILNPKKITLIFFLTYSYFERVKSAVMVVRYSSV